MTTIKDIPEISKGKIAAISKFQQKKHRRREGKFIAEGWKCVEDLVGIYRLETLVVDNATETLPDRLADCGEFELYRAGRAVMEKISGLTTASGALGVFRVPEEENPEFGSVCLDEAGLYLLLDDVQDPGNLGTIIRTAHWMGVDAIYASENTVDIYNSKTIQATMGSMGHVQVYYGDIAALALNNRQLPLVGTFMKGEDVYTKRWRDGVMICMGNEGKGISPRLQEIVTERVTIPPHDIHNHSESLNVGVATSIMLALYRASQARK